MFSSLRSRVHPVFRLFLKFACPLCQRPTAAELCSQCHQELKQHRLCDPAKFWHDSPRIFAWGSYGGSLKRAIAHFKYNNCPDLALPLGQEMAQAWLASPVSRETSNPIIVPIPLHANKQQQRGYNQAELLARQFCHLTGCRLQAHGLQRSQATEALFKLSASQREEALKQAFDVGKEFQQQRPSRPVLIFDDIYTSGATTRSAMQTLRRYGIQVKGVIVLAKAMPWKEHSNTLP